MAGQPKALLSWSSGKDSAWTLHVLRTQHEVEVAGLLTTVNDLFARVAMHAVRVKLLEAQAAAVGLPLWPVRIPSRCSNADYEAALGGAMDRARRESITAVAFGDLFLEDIRRYREDHLAPTGIAPLFPLWGVPTDTLARDMVRAGLKARLTCVDPRHLAPTFAWHALDVGLLGDLAVGIRPTGERGEFHTFAYDGPMFQQPVPV